VFPFEPWVVGLYFGELGRWQVTLPRDAYPPGPGDDEDDEDDGNIEPPDDDDVEDDGDEDDDDDDVEDDGDEDDDDDDDEEDTLWARLQDWPAATHNDVL
jgi:hypothetical protein